MSSKPTCSDPKAPDSTENQNSIGLSDFQMLKTIGKGSYGKVVQVRRLTDGKICAMKTIYPRMNDRQFFIFQIERDILETANSPFVCQLLHHFDTGKKQILVLEFLGGGELYTALSKGAFSEETTRFYAAEVTLALNHLYNKNVVYRDLKSCNVVFNSDGHIKLVDFGLSKKLKKCEKTNTFCGTLVGMAPEIINKEPYNHKVDVWALGCLIYEMLTGFDLFQQENMDATKECILACEVNFPAHFSPQCVELLRGIFIRNPNRRWSIIKVRNSEYFKTMDWDKMLSLANEPPFKPVIKNELDVSNFDAKFTNMAISLKENDNGNKVGEEGGGETMEEDEEQNEFDGFDEPMIYTI